MAVRRTRSPDAEDRRRAAVPEHLRGCIVEDWVEPTDAPRWVDDEINGVPTGVDEVVWRLMLLARRRYKDAAGAWVAQGGVRPFSGRPSFRDESAFLSRVQGVR